MGSQAPIQLPIIDFTELNKQNPDSVMWDTVKTKVFQAFQEYGCFEASLAGISPELRESVFNSLEQLFGLPLETKLRNVPKRVFDGYIGQSEKIPLYESMGIDDVVVSEKVNSFTNLMWPNGNPEFSKNIGSYSNKLSELDEIVRRMVLESLGLEKYFNEHMEQTRYLFRVMKYRVPENNESDMGLGAHADKNIVTILHQNQVGGLEVQTKDGSWIKVKLSPNSFIVMAGETLHAWTNGRLHVPFHRVVMTGKEARFSLGLFSSPNSGTLIKAPEEMVDEEHPLLYKPFEYGEYIKFFYMKENIGDKFPLKKYCGVPN